MTANEILSHTESELCEPRFRHLFSSDKRSHNDDDDDDEDDDFLMAEPNGLIPPTVELNYLAYPNRY